MGIQMQSTKIEHTFIGDAQPSTIIILDKDRNIKRISKYISESYDKTSSEDWIGRGTPLFEMMKKDNHDGLIINHYMVPGLGINELYPKLQFPAQYHSLVKEILKDLDNVIED